MTVLPRSSKDCHLLSLPPWSFSSACSLCRPWPAQKRSLRILRTVASWSSPRASGLTPTLNPRILQNDSARSGKPPLDALAAPALEALVLLHSFQTTRAAGALAAVGGLHKKIASGEEDMYCSSEVAAHTQAEAMRAPKDRPNSPLRSNP